MAHFPIRILLTVWGLSVSLSGCALNPNQGDFTTTTVELSPDYETGQHFMGIRLLGTLELHGTPAPGADTNELSGLAWHAGSETLFAITDRGQLHRFRPIIQDDALEELHWLGHARLKDRHGKPLKGHRSDAEGLALIPAQGAPRLLVSFERAPRLSVFDTKGNWIADKPLPAPLDDISNYASRNSALEALTLHPRLGWITGPERPLKNNHPQLSLFTESGVRQDFDPEPDEHSALTGMTTTPQGDILFLERRYRGMLAPLQIRIRRLTPAPEHSVETLAAFNNAVGWEMDNFEGIAHHRGNRYFAITDNNGNALQRTLLLYFEVSTKPPVSR